MSVSDFKLKKLTHSGGVLGSLAAYLTASFLVAGPWILMVIAIGAMGGIACPDGGCAPLQTFRSAIIYNFAFTLIVTGPLVFMCARYAADRLFEKESGSIFFALAASFGVFLGLAILVAGPFYAFATNLPDNVRLLAFFNVVLVGASWLLTPILGALKDATLAGVAYLVGATIMILLASVVRDLDTGGLLLAFNVGMTAINGILLLAIVRKVRFEIRPDPNFLAALRGRWELPLIGLAYYLGIWVDKLIMWAAAPDGRAVVAGALWTMPDYDTAMFWAQLSALPMLAVFFVQIEPGLRRRARTFFDLLNRHASLEDMKGQSRALTRFALSGVFGLFLAQLAICALAMLMSLVAVEAVGLRASQMGMLRNALVGVTSHTAAMFCSVFLLYFDLRRSALVVLGVFLALNIVLTLLTLQLGFAWWGFGFGAAAAAAFITGLILLSRELPMLLFHAFITNNPSAKR